ncbi:MAG: holo-ACP synthase [Microbacterium sp.]
MIIGTGIDLVDIARFERTIERTPKLLPRLFTPAEQSLRASSLAARYAAKEALIKALGGSDGVHWTEIEIASAVSGAPRFELSGTTAEVVRDRRITALHLTLTHDAGLAAAFVVAEGEPL